jgi:hypothetical protein
MGHGPNYFIKDDNPDWKDARTFEEWVIQMVEEGKTEDPGFQAALAFHGRPKLGAIWKAHIAKKKEEQPGDAS